MEWNGPDLGPSSPSSCLPRYDSFGMRTAPLYLANWDCSFGRSGFVDRSGGAVSWRPQEFWVYLGTSVGRLTLLGGAGTFFGLLALRDDTGGNLSHRRRRDVGAVVP
jgi:hypothetical protein